MATTTFTRARRGTGPDVDGPSRGRVAVRSAVALCAVCCICVGIDAPARASHPSWTSPAERITFVEVDPDFTDFDIGDIRADGSGRRQLAPHPAFDISPEYSPDGRRIAFTSGRSAPSGSENDPAYSETYVMQSDGSGVRRITANVGFRDSSPSWSPDGKWLVLARGPAEGTEDLWLVHLGTGRERQLTSSPDTNEYFPDWSPDGRRILFQGDLAAPGNEDIYSIRTDGSGMRRLTTSPALRRRCSLLARRRIHRVRLRPDGQRGRVHHEE